MAISGSWSFQLLILDFEKAQHFDFSFHVLNISLHPSFYCTEVLNVMSVASNVLCRMRKVYLLVLKFILNVSEYSLR